MHRFLGQTAAVALLVIGASGVAAHAGLTYETEVLLIEDADGSQDDNFGDSVAAEGNWMAVGSPYDPDSGTDAGAVHLYKWNVGSFEQVETIRPGDLGDFSKFGMSVAMDGDWLIVGCPGDSEYGNTAGAVYVYEISSTGASFKQKVDSGDAEDFAQFGYSVAVSGDVFLGGSPYAGGGGAVSSYVLETGNWQYVEYITDTWGFGNIASFGYDIDFDGSQAVIGAPLATDADGNSNRGAALVLQHQGGGVFESSGIAVYSTASELNSKFGYAVSIDGSILAVGAPYYDSGKGHVDFFNNDSGWWYAYDVVTPPSLIDFGDGYGHAIEVASVGNTVYIGSPSGSGIGSNTGCVHAMTVGYTPGVGYTAEEETRYVASWLSGAAVGGVGYSLVSTGEKVYAGAPYANSSAGSVMYFGEERYWMNPSGGIWEEIYNWSGEALPGPGSPVYFGLPGSFLVWCGIFTNYQIESLEVFDGDVELGFDNQGEFLLNNNNGRGLQVGTLNSAFLTLSNAYMSNYGETIVGAEKYGTLRLVDSTYFATEQITVGKEQGGVFSIVNTFLGSNKSPVASVLIDTGGLMTVESLSTCYMFPASNSDPVVVIRDGVFSISDTAEVNAGGRGVQIDRDGSFVGNGLLILDQFNGGAVFNQGGVISPTLDTFAGDDILEIQGGTLLMVGEDDDGNYFEGRLMTSTWDGVDAAYTRVGNIPGQDGSGYAFLGGVYELHVPASNSVTIGDTFRVLEAEESIIDNFSTYLVPYVDEDSFFRFGFGGSSPPCAVDEIEDCNGNCCPATWLGDGICDDGTYSWNDIPIYLNCAALNCDNGDCDPAECDDGRGRREGDRGGSGGGASINGEVADLVIPFGFNSLVSGLTINGEAISVRAMNIDDDVDDDLVVLASSTDSGDAVCIFLNDGGTLCLYDEVVVSSAPTDMATGDFDDDGDEDIAVTCRSLGKLGKLVILRNDGGGVFTSVQTLDTGNNPSALTVFDWNNDSLPDIALVNQNDDTLYVYENSSTFRSIGFGTPDSSGTSENPSGIAPGDVDPGGDKDEDVVVSGADGEITYHINDGGSWDSTVLFDTGNTIGSLAVLDMDLDGFDDAFVSYPDSDESGVIYGPTDDLNEDVLPIDGSGFDAVDLDGDGDEDGTFEGPGGAGRGSIAIRVLRNDSDGQPIDVVVFMDVPGDDVSGTSTINTGMDVDGDGHQDLVAVANTSTPEFSINVQTSVNGSDWNPGTCDPCDAALPTTCPADVSGTADEPDGFVNVADLLAVIANWGQSGDGTTRPLGDCRPLPNGDCTVNVADLLGIIAEWGATCSP